MALDDQNPAENPATPANSDLPPPPPRMAVDEDDADDEVITTEMYDALVLENNDLARENAVLTERLQGVDVSASEKLAKAESALAESRADAQNYRRRVDQEKQDAKDFAIKSLALELLAVVDNFDDVIKAAGSGDKDALVTGVKLVEAKLLAALAKSGVTVIPAEKGTPFDPNFHESLMRVEAPDQASETIVDVMRKGYQLKGRILRAPLVTITP